VLEGVWASPSRQIINVNVRKRNLLVQILNMDA